MTWTPIRRGEVVVAEDDFDPFAGPPGAVLFRILLNARLPAEWVKLLDSPDVAYVTTWASPTYNAAETALEIVTSSDRIEAWVKELDIRISSANRRYETEVLPRQAAQQRATEDAEARRQAELAEARRVAADL